MSWRLSCWSAGILGLAGLLGSVHLASGQEQEECHEEQVQRMQERFQNCTFHLTVNYDNTKNSAGEKSVVRAAVCVLLSDTVEVCGKMWSECHSPSEVRRLQDMHLETMMAQYGEELDTANCRTVRNYLESGRREDNSNIGVCSDSDFVLAQNNFQKCSHEKSTTAYHRIQEFVQLEDEEAAGADSRGEDLYTRKGVPDDILQVICSTLSFIENSCVEVLQTCFIAEDIVRMKTSHIEGMKEYLVTMTQGSLTREEIDRCPATPPQPSQPEVVTLSSNGFSETSEDLARQEEVRREKIRQEEARRQDITQEAARREEIRQETARREGIRQEEARRENIRQEAEQRENIRQEESRREEIRREKARREEVRLEEARREEVRLEEARREEVRLEEARREKRRRQDDLREERRKADEEPDDAPKEGAPAEYDTPAAAVEAKERIDFSVSGGQTGINPTVTLLLVIMCQTVVAKFIL